MCCTFFKESALKGHLSEFAKVWENYTEKGPENLVYFELGMINAVSTADVLLIECSLPIRLIILSPMWNITDLLLCSLNLLKKLCEMLWKRFCWFIAYGEWILST